MSYNSFNSLINDGVLCIKKIMQIKSSLDYDIKDYDKRDLNEKQKEIVKDILDEDKKLFLIRGVTGSGKTEIYLSLVEDMLKNNKSSIIPVSYTHLTFSKW